MENKISENVVKVVNTIKTMSEKTGKKEFSYYQVCTWLNVNFGSGVFTSAVKRGMLTSRKDKVDCYLVNATNSEIIGKSSKEIVFYSIPTQE